MARLPDSPVHRRSFAALGLLLSLSSGCANRPPPLYLWESFPRQQYEFLLHDGMNPGEQILALESHAEKARGAHAALPPGLRAHLGLLYLNSGNVERARELWLAEKLAFPESTPFLDQLLKRLDGQAGTTLNQGAL
jgi:hypothetical protein